MTEVPANTHGRLQLNSGPFASLVTRESEFSIPYTGITSLEYGQKVNRRIVESLLINPVFALSKKRRHFLTIGFVDANGHRQAAFFEIGKDNIHAVVIVLENRSGRKLEFESDEARKQYQYNDYRPLLKRTQQDRSEDK